MLSHESVSMQAATFSNAKNFYKNNISTPLYFVDYCIQKPFVSNCLTHCNKVVVLY